MCSDGSSEQVPRGRLWHGECPGLPPDRQDEDWGLRQELECTPAGSKAA